MNTIIKNKIILAGSIAGCVIIRLVPYKAPNVEPILAILMPYAKKYKALYGFLFGLCSIVLYDTITGTVGIWTLFTASSYAVIGAFAAHFFKNRQASRRNFFLFAIVSTLFYDTITGLFVGPVIFHQAFSVALVGQIPFTALHLLGNCTLSLCVSPAVYGLLTYRKQRKRSVVISEIPLLPIYIR